MEGYHSSVLLREILDYLKVKKDYWYLDCTLGDGGHSLEILKRGGRVVGLDVDPQALQRAKERLDKSGLLEKAILIQGNFRDFKNLISRREIVPRFIEEKQMDTERLEFAGAIFDLGVSSLQLESPDRGFSFGKEGPLDMRMDPLLETRALDLVNGLNKGELYELFDKLGEEKYSHSLAEAVVGARALKPIQTTLELAEIAKRVVRKRSGKIHPATKIFQALRIAINDELNALKTGLLQVKEYTNGVILVISFHSLEDRIVKLTFRDWEERNLGGVLTKKPIVPTLEEIFLNPRARSAKLRVFKTYDNHQKIRAGRE